MFTGKIIATLKTSMHDHGDPLAGAGDGVSVWSAKENYLQGPAQPSLSPSCKGPRVCELPASSCDPHSTRLPKQTRSDVVCSFARSQASYVKHPVRLQGEKAHCHRRSPVTHRPVSPRREPLRDDAGIPHSLRVLGRRKMTLEPEVQSVQPCGRGWQNRRNSGV